MNRQTKVKAITQKTKEKVWNRQHGHSLLGGDFITVSECCCHYRGRGVQGVGYEWNIIGLTPTEHQLLDENKDIIINGRFICTHEQALTRIRNHLMANYIGWSEEKCIYDKYKFEESEYGVKRREKPFR